MIDWQKVADKMYFSFLPSGSPGTSYDGDLDELQRLHDHFKAGFLSYSHVMQRPVWLTRDEEAQRVTQAMLPLVPKRRVRFLQDILNWKKEEKDGTDHNPPRSKPTSSRPATGLRLQCAGYYGHKRD